MARKSAERTTYRVQVLERAVDILQVLSEDSRELAAGEVAERLSLHKSTIHRLLTVLDQHNARPLPSRPIRVVRFGGDHAIADSPDGTPPLVRLRRARPVRFRPDFRVRARQLRSGHSRRDRDGNQ